MHPLASKILVPAQMCKLWKTSTNDLRHHWTVPCFHTVFACHLVQVRQAFHNNQKFTLPSNSFGESVSVSRKLFTDAVSLVQPSRKFFVKHCGLLRVKRLIGRHAVRLHLPPYLGNHSLVHVEHFKPTHFHPDNISSLTTALSRPLVDKRGETFIEAHKTLSHPPCVRSHQFITSYEDAPTHKAEWRPSCNFLGPDSTIAGALYF